MAAADMPQFPHEPPAGAAPPEFAAGIPICNRVNEASVVASIGG